ncbi:hypothetical protein GW17_00026155 [Ensete ventricosum]|nr:hypothetical protein GW17_00026155 [Ensete ventricosum]
MQSDKRATIYYESDATFLCWACDTFVHDANFLVARHLCQVIYATCHFLDASCRLSSASLQRVRPSALCAISILLPPLGTSWPPRPLALASPPSSP